MRAYQMLLPAMLGLAAVSATRSARADVTYNFVTTAAQGQQVVFDGFLNDGTGFTGFPLSLTFTAAGIASGEVSGTETADLFGPTQITGLAGFVSLATYMDGATLGTLYNSLSLDVVFNGAGQITSDSIDFSGTDLTISITNGAASLGSDGLLNCAALVDSGACTATGSFVAATAVPEPGSLPIMLVALGSLLAFHRARH